MTPQYVAGISAKTFLVLFFGVQLELYLGRIFISIIAGLKLKEEVLEDSADIIEMEVQDPLG
jgi:hypothetical protein